MRIKYLIEVIVDPPAKDSFRGEEWIDDKAERIEANEKRAIKFADHAVMNALRRCVGWWPVTAKMLKREVRKGSQDFWE